MLPARLVQIFPLCLIAGVAAVSSSLRAATPPDAGQIFQQQQPRQDTPPRSPEPSKPAIEQSPFGGGDFRPAERRPEQAPAVTSATRRVAVKSFRIAGLTIAPEAAVQGLLEAHRNRESTITQLHEAATVVQEYLRGLGYLVRVFVPTQDVKDGVVELRIVESRIGAIQVLRGEGLRVNDETIKNYFVEGGQAVGDLLQQARIERDLLMVNDLAGVRARAILVPGSDPGSTTLMLNALAEPFVQGGISLDNSGNKFTGRDKLDGELRLNSPTGIGDSLSLRGSVSSNSEFSRIAYNTPLGSSGLAVGGAYSYNSYRLCCEFTPLQQNGWARSYNLFASYPLVRSLARSVSASLAYADKRIYSKALGVTSGDHKGTSWTPGLNGTWQDQWTGAPARSSWNLQISFGETDLSSSPDRAADAATALTNGHFNKTTLNLGRAQKLNENWTLLAALRAQIASKNLDSSEKLFLGGVSGVRAYPSGEAIGDSGVFLNAEVQREIAPKWLGSLFLDTGFIQLHQNPWTNWQAGNPNIKNKYALSGTGLSLTWQPGNEITVRMMLATPLGRNPGRDVAGRNSENGKDGARFWGALSWSF